MPSTSTPTGSLLRSSDLTQGDGLDVLRSTGILAFEGETDRIVVRASTC